MSADPIPPQRRADAELNRSRILAAARTAFADPDVAVSMAEVSRRAGVGMATLYRNFPDRRELLEALYADEVEAVCRAAQHRGSSPGATLIDWLRRFYDFATSKRHIVTELLAYTEGTDPGHGEMRARARARGLAAGRPLLAAAQQSHEVREDLTIEQVLDMVIAVATITAAPRYLEPILETVLDGLRTHR